MLELISDEVLVTSELLLVVLSDLVSDEFSPLTTFVEELLLVVLSVLVFDELPPLSDELLVVLSLKPFVVEFWEIPPESDMIGCSFEQAASVMPSAIIEIILHSFFMICLLRINSFYHFCGNSAHYR